MPTKDLISDKRNLLNIFLEDLKELEKMGIRKFSLQMIKGENYEISEMIKLITKK